MLLAHNGEDEIVVNNRVGKKSERVERIRRLVALTGPPAGADCDEGLRDVPPIPERVGFRIEKGGDARVLVGLEAEMDHQRNQCQSDNQHENQPAFRDMPDEHHAKQNRHPDDAGAEVRLDENHQPRRADDGSAAEDAQEGRHGPCV